MSLQGHDTWTSIQRTCVARVVASRITRPNVYKGVGHRFTVGINHLDEQREGHAWLVLPDRCSEQSLIHIEWSLRDFRRQCAAKCVDCTGGL